MKQVLSVLVTITGDVSPDNPMAPEEVKIALDKAFTKHKVTVSYDRGFAAGQADMESRYRYPDNSGQ